MENEHCSMDLMQTILDAIDEYFSETDIDFLIAQIRAKKETTKNEEITLL